MSAQNFELQDELAAAERALELERRNKGPSWSSQPTARCGRTQTGASAPRTPYPYRCSGSASAGRQDTLREDESSRCPFKTAPNRCTRVFTLWWPWGVCSSWFRTLLAPPPAALRGKPGAAPVVSANPLQTATNEVLKAAKLLTGKQAPAMKSRKSRKRNPSSYLISRIQKHTAVGRLQQEKQ